MAQLVNYLLVKLRNNGFNFEADYNPQRLDQLQKTAKINEYKCFNFTNEHRLDIVNLY